MLYDKINKRGLHMKMIELGSSNYKDFIEKDLYYVDKTLMIEELIEKTSKVVLVTRPRRFGKTLNLSMLEHYFDISINSDYLFKGKDIEKTEMYKRHLNKYPVIFLTLKGVKGSSFDSIYSSFKTSLSNLYSANEYILKSNNLSSTDKNLFNKVLEGEASIGQYKNSLYKLSEFLYKFYNKKVIILLDEYDSIVNSILDKDLYEQVIDLLRGLIGDALKGNNYLEKGVLTGILRIAKEELFSGANNIEVFTILNDNFKDKFGFTELEVQNSLNQFNLEKANDVKYWYNGYSFGKDKITMYNPYSISNYLKTKVIGNYWINTAQGTFIKNLLFNSNFDIKVKLNELTLGKEIAVLIEENIVMSELDNPENLWSLLLFSGYLKVISNDDYKFRVSVVNEEVKNYLKKLINIHFEKIAGSTLILDSLKIGDIEMFSEELKRISLRKISYYYIKEENSYHMFLFGLFMNLENEYDPTTNREAGYGRYDICLEPYDKTKVGYVFELKKIEQYEKENEEELAKRLELAAKNALKQIEAKNYLTILESKHIKAISIGIAFAGKKVHIKYKKQ